MPAAYRFGSFELQPDQRRLLVNGHPAVLGPRAFDLLVALVERAGQLVSKHELLDVVWPGLVVEENNLQVQISTLRKLIGPQAIATIPARGYRFTQALDGAVADEPSASPSTAALVDALPPLIGREDDLIAVRALVLAHGAVTVAGAGGIGKTTLARALADQLRNAFSDGVCLVELAPVSDPSMVATVVANALQIKHVNLSPIDAITEALTPRKMLVVLDNCEHLLQAAAELVEALRRAASGVHWLVTSQAPLKLVAEQVFRLDTLALPADETLDAARSASAVVLFEARARSADPRFTLTEANVSTAIDICRRLDGIALAIELAAARVPLLGLEGLRKRLGERLRLLTGGTRLALPRHQTLRAALEWSHGLLTPAQQTVFRRLAVFVGGFTLDAAQEVAGDDAIDAWTVLDELGALIDKSLLVPGDDGAPDPRYSMLETVRDYARAQLEASGESDVLHQRHAVLFAEFAESHWGTVGSAKSGEMRAPLAAEHDNLRASVDWLTEHDAALGMRAAAALIPFWRERGHHAEAIRRCAALLSQPGAPTANATRERLLIGLCGLTFEQRDTRQLQSYAEQALAGSRASGNRPHEGSALTWLAHAEYYRGNLAGAEAQFRASLAVLREVGDARVVAESLTNIACVLTGQGEPPQALLLLHEAQALYRQIGNRWGLGFVAEILGEAAYAMGDFETARAHAQESLDEHRALRHQHRIASSLHRMACAEHRLGRLDEAHAYLTESLAINCAHGFAGHKIACLAAMARIATSAGDGLRAARLFGATQKLLDESGVHLEGPDRADHAGALAQARGLVDANAWAVAWQQGHRMTTEEAIRLALASS